MLKDGDRKRRLRLEFNTFSCRKKKISACEVNLYGDVSVVGQRETCVNNAHTK